MHYYDRKGKGIKIKNSKLLQVFIKIRKIFKHTDVTYT